MLVEGQIHGGGGQGIGAALQEQQLYNEAGPPLVTSLQGYQPPKEAQVPPIVVEHLETPSPINPLGAIGATAAVANAVADALGQLASPSQERRSRRSASGACFMNLPPAGLIGLHNVGVDNAPHARQRASARCKSRKVRRRERGKKRVRNQ